MRFIVDKYFVIGSNMSISPIFKAKELALLICVPPPMTMILCKGQIEHPLNPPRLAPKRNS